MNCWECPVKNECIHSSFEEKKHFSEFCRYVQGKEKAMLVDRFMKFLKEQDPLIPCGIDKDWIIIDEAEISVDKLEIFLRGIIKKGTTCIK